MMANGFTLSLRAAESAPLLRTASLREARPGKGPLLAASNDPLALRETLLRRYGWLRGWVDTAQHLKDSQKSLLDRMKNDLARALSRVDRARRPTVPCPGSCE
jgi:hypothetical protein